jgi:hypothetical protein
MFGTLFILFYVLNRRFYGNKQFESYVQIISALSTLFIALGIVYQQSTFNDQRQDYRIKLYLTYPKILLEEINQLFLDHPEMNYYYNELFNGQTEHQHREIMMEAKINFSILSKIMEQVSILHYTEGLDPSIFKKSLDKIVSVFFQSESFKQYYQQHFKRQFANQYLIKYVSTRFGL